MKFNSFNVVSGATVAYIFENAKDKKTFFTSTV